MYSTCEHHLRRSTVRRMSGTSRVWTAGDGSVEVGARRRSLCAKRPPGAGERLTGQIADAVMRKLKPRGVIVVVEAEHLCMAMRGVRKPGAVTTTSAVRGQFKTDKASRAEALDLILRK